MDLKFVTINVIHKCVYYYSFCSSTTLGLYAEGLKHSTLHL